MGAACGAHADYDFVCALDLACLAKDLELVVQVRSANCIHVIDNITAQFILRYLRCFG